MTKITVPRAVLEQALEASKQDNPAGRGATIRALQAALEQQEPEPVAWRSTNANPPGGFVIFQQYPQALADLGTTIEPLYTHPPRRAPEQEPVAWAVYDKRGGSKSLHWHEQHSPDGDSTVYDAVPLSPRREWQALTPEEVNNCIQKARSNHFVRDGSTSEKIARAIESKLKEKNT